MYLLLQIEGYPYIALEGEISLLLLHFFLEYLGIAPMPVAMLLTRLHLRLTEGEKNMMQSLLFAFVVVLAVGGKDYSH